jgi:hypothetical protein
MAKLQAGPHLRSEIGPALPQVRAVRRCDFGQLQQLRQPIEHGPVRELDRHSTRTLALEHAQCFLDARLDGLVGQRKQALVDADAQAADRG